MKKRWWMGLAIGAVAVLVCLVPFFHLRNVYAVRSAYTIFRQQNTSIARGQVVDDALILGHNVNLSGHVYEILAVINGNVHVTSSGSADILVDLGGQIFLDHGAHVHQLYHLSLSTPFWNGVLLGGMFALLLWMGMLVLSMGLLFITTIVAWVFQEYTVVPFNILKSSARTAGIAGLLMTVICLAVSGLLAVTLIAIPLAAVAVVLFVIAGILGLSVVALWIGDLFWRESNQKRPEWVRAMMGSSLMLAFCNLPWIGLLFFCIFWLIGIGTIALWLGEVWRKRGKRGKAMAS
ncbi:hypothetical protein [Alicyclobacillus tolerans]|uniref:Uncharacterized protein n=1 Tax=Alicyclobacillus tolerans TaxID=90970 RepID=A0A1M6QNX0_9BACL|nr:hypothetical protein [Alicyclobacillus montanus]SHK21838.1 hypothetical protein SAMN05443507_11062 [Alicyclobacillus montanus]